MRAIGGEFVHARVAVAVGDEHLSGRRHVDVGRKIERAAAVCHVFPGIGSAVARRDTRVGAHAFGADGAQELARRREQHHLAVIAIDQPQLVVPVSADRVRKCEQTRAPRRQDVALAIEHDDGMILGAVEAVDAVLGIHRHRRRRNLPAFRKCAPSLPALCRCACRFPPQFLHSTSVLLDTCLARAVCASRLTQ